MRGRKPKPLRLKVLQGTDRKSDHNEPQPRISSGLPRAPQHLNKVAQKEWRRMVKELHPIGLLTNIDLTALAAYCSLYSLWIDANQQIQKHGTLIKAQSGFPMQSPYLQISNKAQMEMRKWLVEFGGTPSSRRRVDAVPVQEETELEKFLNKGKKLEGKR